MSGKCKTCRHWNPYDTRANSKEGWCDIFSNPNKYLWAYEDPERQIDTSPNFGCIEYKKEEAHNG